MMKLTCPKCHLNLRVPDQRVPASGGWAQCPRCRERFFINPAASSIDDLTRPFTREQPGSAAQGAGSRHRDTSSQRLLDRLKIKRGQPGEKDYEPGLIAVYPESLIPEAVYRAASLTMLCLPVAAIFLLFLSASSRLDREPSARPEPAAAVERLNDQENPELIRRDLLNIRRDQIIRTHNIYGVGYSGPESRVFKYFMNRLAPEVCSKIDYLQINVPRRKGYSGFIVNALCLEPEGRRLEMRVDWMGSSNSRITFPYNNRSEIFPLYSASGGDAELQPAGAASPGAAAAAAALTRRPLAVETATRPVAGSLD